MANSGWVTAFRSDVAANRETNPEVPDKTFAFFYATDTKTLTMWNGAAWVNPSEVFTIKAVTFANLPATPIQGMLRLVTDAAAAYAKAATVAAGGGANIVLAVYNGTNWVSV